MSRSCNISEEHKKSRGNGSVEALNIKQKFLAGHRSTVAPEKGVNQAIERNRQDNAHGETKSSKGTRIHLTVRDI